MRNTYVVVTAQAAFAWLSKAVGFTAYILASGLIISMSIILLLQVTFRYVFMLPLAWSEEAARFCLIWFGMLAACVAGQQGLHFSLRWVVNMLTPSLREALRIFVLTFNCVVLLFVSYAGVRYIPVINTLTATATHINLAWIYSAIPVGCIGLALINFAELADAVLSPFTGQHMGVYRTSEEAAYNQLLVGDDS